MNQFLIPLFTTSNQRTGHPKTRETELHNQQPVRLKKRAYNTSYIPSVLIKISDNTIQLIHQI